MNCILFESSQIELDQMAALCRDCGVTVDAGFTDAIEGINYLQHCQTDIVLIDWFFSGIGGPDLGRLIQSFVPDQRLIYVSDQDVDAELVFRANACGYLRKPIDPERLLSCLNSVTAAKPESAPNHQVIIHTFGHFDIYVDGQPVFFRNSRAKELLALLVDRQGGIMSSTQIVTSFWPDCPVTEQHKAIYRKAAAALKQTLNEYGIGYILHASRNQKAINAAAVDCDYYHFLNGDKDAVGLYQGEYMADYPWGEDTNGKLWRMSGYWEADS